MDYLTQYYKNLSEQLQEQVNLLEAGLKKALDTGDTQLMKKELAKRKAKKDRLQDEAAKLNKRPGHKGALAAHSKFAQAEALKQGIEDLTMPLEASGIRTGIKLSDLPTEKAWNPEPFPTPAEMADNFYTQGRKRNK
jgi:hypothetical protein